ncbi:MAG: glycosyltransferase [Magnetococcus sp. YQC-5]
MYPSQTKIAVILPCYNEEASIAQVVNEFRQVLPQADIFVYDNQSSDNTALVAKQAGAEVLNEPKQGKGHVVRRMFSDIDADIYVMADGDGTYDAQAAPTMIELLLTNHLDMVVGLRQDAGLQEQYRPGHRLGNQIFSNAVAFLFGYGFSDMLSGYRVFSRRFVKTFPAISKGFEIETEFTIHALHYNLPCQEIPTRYFARAPGTSSKLNTFRDGIRILKTILVLAKEVRPFAFFGMIALLLALLAIVLAIPIFITFFKIGLVPRMPTAMLCLGMMLMSCISITIGIILDSISRTRIEMYRLHYLHFAPSQHDRRSTSQQESPP